METRKLSTAEGDGHFPRHGRESYETIRAAAEKVEDEAIQDAGGERLRLHRNSNKRAS